MTVQVCGFLGLELVAALQAEGGPWEWVYDVSSAHCIVLEHAVLAASLHLFLRVFLLLVIIKLSKRSLACALLQDVAAISKRPKSSACVCGAEKVCLDHMSCR